MSHVVAIDGMNFMHRSRSGWQMGPAPVVFNFMRNFRSIIDQLKPTRVYFVLEGKALHRKEAFKEYKANRVIDPESPEAAERAKFFAQSDEVIALLKTVFPVTVVRHPHFECDDTIYNLIKRGSSAVQWTVVSNDSDFTQLLNEFDNVKIWNPMKKGYVVCPEYDYVTWKSLRGDGSDNIPGIPGVGDKTAESLSRDSKMLDEFLTSDVVKSDTFIRNYDLIKFAFWSDEECLEMTSSSPNRDWTPLRDAFEKYGFSSLLKEGSWDKFVGTFDSLWGNNPETQDR
jgi:5'-3' exonuclease